MKVADFMSVDPVTIAPDLLLPKVWILISQKHVHGLPVVNNKKRLVGFVSKEDMLAKLFPETEDPEEMFADTDTDIEERLGKLKKMTVDKIMNTHVMFTRVDTPLLRALSRMIVRKVRQLPVLDENDRLVGMISKGDVFKGVFRNKAI